MALDTTVYTSSLALTTSSAHTVATSLLTLVPRPLPPTLRPSVNALRKSAVKHLSTWSATANAGEPVRAKPLDERADASWRALSHRLRGAWERPDDHPHSAIGEKYLELLFSDGLAFLNLRMSEQWAEADRRLAVLTAADIRAIDEAAGPGYLDEVLEAHKAYGGVLGITSAAQAAPSAASLRDTIRELTANIQHYAIAVLATYPTVEGKLRRANEEQVGRLLAPIAKHRALSRREPAPEPTAPPPQTSIPEVPADDEPTPEEPTRPGQ